MCLFVNWTRALIFSCTTITPHTPNTTPSFLIMLSPLIHGWSMMCKHWEFLEIHWALNLIHGTFVTCDNEEKEPVRLTAPGWSTKILSKIQNFCLTNWGTLTVISSKHGFTGSKFKTEPNTKSHFKIVSYKIEEILLFTSNRRMTVNMDTWFIDSVIARRQVKKKIRLSNFYFEICKSC